MLTEADVAERRKPEQQSEAQRASAATAVIEREPAARRDVETLQLQRVAAAIGNGRGAPPRADRAVLALQCHAGNRAMATAMRPKPVQRDFFAENVYDNPTNKKQKAANVAAHLGEGVLNSLIAPINPRWWKKAYTDIAQIKAADYGSSGSKIAKLFAGLASTSQVLQKVATIAGIVSLLASIAGAVTGGAAVAVGAIAGFIAMLASSVAAAIQLVLVLRNIGSLDDDDRKKRFFADLAAFIGASLGAVAGGLGTNFGDGGVGMAGGAAAVTDKFIGGSEMGKTWAGAGFGQMFGTVGDSVSEGIVQTKRDDELQRQLSAPPAKESDAGQMEALASLLSISGNEVAASAAWKRRAEAKEHDATKLTELLATPAKGPDVPGAKGSPEPAGAAALALPAKVSELGGVDEKAVGQGIERARDPKTLDQLETKVEQVEQAVDGGGGAPAGAKKKPSALKRFGAWLAEKATGLKGRLARALAKAKAKLLGFALQLFGVSDDFKVLTQEAPAAAAEGKAQSELAAETATEATKAGALLAKARSGG